MFSGAPSLRLLNAPGSLTRIQNRNTRSGQVRWLWTQSTNNEQAQQLDKTSKRLYRNYLIFFARSKLNPAFLLASSFKTVEGKIFFSRSVFLRNLGQTFVKIDRNLLISNIKLGRSHLKMGALYCI